MCCKFRLLFSFTLLLSGTLKYVIPATVLARDRAPVVQVTSLKLYGKKVRRLE